MVGDARKGDLSQYDELTRNLTEASLKWQQVLAKMSEEGAMLPDGMVLAVQNGAFEAISQIGQELATHPQKMLGAGLEWYSSYVSLLDNVTSRMTDETVEPLYKSSPKDRRFTAEQWDNVPFFDLLKQSYLMTSNWLEALVDKTAPDAQTARKTHFFTRQIIEAFCPGNFLATNPEVLQETLTSNGQNLLRGLDHMLDDLNGGISISMAPKDAFTIGKDIAVTQGEVVFRNKMMELIRYAPLTKQVHANPLIIIPPWINKYYILDMRPENSFVKWLLEQGHQLFMISWVNPDSQMAGTSFDDYLTDGALKAMEVARELCNAKQANMMGYCIGGTLLACMLSYLNSKQREGEVASATFLTTLVDFTDTGDLGIFIDDDMLEAMERQVQQTGLFSGHDLSLTFRMLRSRELIWSFFVNNYLMGRDPFPFDLLFWNSDSTSMPANMYMFYLREMYKHNRLIQKNALQLAGVPMDLSAITTPSYMLSAQEDHIAPWQSTYAATQIYKGMKRFVLSGSGHIAGVINPPHKNKYGYKVLGDLEIYPADAQSWLDGAQQYDGSWWEDWNRWIESYSGGMRDAPSSSGDALLPAPGHYVLS